MRGNRRIFKCYTGVPAAVPCRRPTDATASALPVKGNVMKLHADVTKTVDRSPDGPQVGAFFDFDGTLIAGFSVTAFMKEQLRRGDVAPGQFLELMAAATNFSLGNLGFSGLMVASAKLLRGVSEQSYVEFGEEVYEKHVARLIYPESRALVEAHFSKGHTVAIVSSATPYQVRPAARDLKIKHVLCSELAVEDGLFSGGVIEPLCWGPGKVTAAEKLAAETDIDLDQSFFYSDSHEDLDLLKRVGYPQPMNPTAKLVEVAERSGWPIRRFGSRGRPRTSDVIRSVLATGSIIPSFVAGLPIWALTGSKREAQNFSLSLFADTASALIGLHLDIENEHNLWIKRPAVFVFNHQSKADVVIIAKLLRRNIAGIGKKEIGNIPVIGKIMEFGGTVFIDRENAANALKAMAPLVDVMRVDGKSVVIAPEGTRSITPNLGRFKKGAFHLAMQARVPIVPIVIHNAIDVAPKGDFVFRRATVSVKVLDPVDTSDWRADTISQHVADVRALYLETLGQTDLTLDEPGPDVPARGEPGENEVPKRAAKPKSKTRRRASANGRTAGAS